MIVRISIKTIEEVIHFLLTGRKKVVIPMCKIRA
jgi:hypothetical protein